ncbi:RNA polymerase sigma-70 factor, ECF subfamily [Nitrosomonas cryotolerans]|uniref:RNA polymerase sigma-70 factor, ECF subfamily n=1 Tax=Nitrosomonas cryotolerans ATCC 49181 TaxID=1131553 RepID=A0A1N6I9F5_9PROT|nr:RNA polymerase factor sigma-70 [Nitrosomonas cryotolerans]SFP83505.1 RNA polymerase sigma-70 factor, ECF subfamily [Nitrosomonas cryotolerans]SIO28609.1 RNA polymerase sigma-70 factor, ECF subfamily [Nitrosomonas cryotolerans ATCC 49181]
MKIEQAPVADNEASNTTDFTDPVFLQQLRIQMLKFASLQLRDEALAEDAVQEALIGALKNAGSFGRRSALKTWVFAILKNKITDVLRKGQRMVEASRLTSGHENEENLDTLFDIKGFWQESERPASWSQPMESVKNTHFWRVFETCLNDLPENQARLFMMREFLELNSTEICETLNITTSNLHVMLYRARLHLRECLENRWFSEGKKS